MRVRSRASGETAPTRRSCRNNSRLTMVIPVLEREGDPEFVQHAEKPRRVDGRACSLEIDHVVARERKAFGELGLTDAGVFTSRLDDGPDVGQLSRRQRRHGDLLVGISPQYMMWRYSHIS